jgi:AcrR family transcriptional regulator
MSVLEDSSDKRTYMRADDRRAQILACARQVFAHRGFHVTRIADVCRAAGIGRGTLYQYFDNKHDLFVGVVAQLAERIKVVLDSRPRVAAIEGAGDAPRKLIVAFCERRLRELLEAVFVDEASLRLILREARGLDGAIDEVIRRVDEVVLDALVADLATAQRLGLLEDHDPRMAALFVLGGIEKLCLAALERDEPIDLDVIVRVATRIELLGLLAPRIAGSDEPSQSPQETR